MAIPLAVTRNISLAVGFGLAALPFIAWMGMASGWLVIWSVALGLLMAARFTLPPAAPGLKPAAPRVIFDRWRRNKR